MGKIKTLMLLCILPVFGIANAQQQLTGEINVEKGVRLSFNAGTHFSNMIGEAVQKDDYLWITKTDIHNYRGTLYAGGYQKPLWGYKLGFGVTFDRTKNFAWGLDLNLETKGCLIPIKNIVFTDYSGNDIYKESSAASDLYSKIRLNYIVVPARAEFKYKKFYCAPGIYTGLLVSAVNTTKLDYKDKHFDFRHNVSSHYALIDLGVFLNAGFCFPLPKSEFIKVGLVGEWNVNGIKSIMLDGSGYSFFSNQVLGLELKYGIKVK